MRLLEEPSQLLALPTNTFKVPAIQQPGLHTRLPHLKVQITPSILVQSNVISEHVQDRRLEECGDVVVPVGGRVGLVVQVDVTELLGSGADVDSEMNIEEDVRNRIEAFYRKVRSAIIMLNLPLAYNPPESGRHGTCWDPNPPFDRTVKDIEIERRSLIASLLAVSHAPSRIRISNTPWQQSCPIWCPSCVSVRLQHSHDLGDPSTDT